MYHATKIVGDFFEQEVIRLFGLVRTDVDSLAGVPDLIAKDNSFFVEVKASAYNNGGVINRRQLYRFDKNIDLRRFYAFAYHSISRHMQRDYPTEEELKNALGLRSLFLFPFSIVKAHFERSKKRKTPKHDTFVQLREHLAQAIFQKEKTAWRHLGLASADYRMAQPHERVHLVTRAGHLEQEILDSFNSEFL